MKRWNQILAHGTLLACLTAGCVPTITDFARQEFVVQEKPVVHLALRGSRRERKLVCQVFLLTMNEAMWISGVDLRLADGTFLDPKQIESLDESDQEDSSPMWLGFGAGYTRGPYYRNYPYYRRYWRPGPYSDYRTRSGLCVPTWYLLRRSRGDRTPGALEFTYDLPPTTTTTEGGKIVVHVAVKPEEDRDAQPNSQGKSKEIGKAEAAAQDEQRIRSPFPFSLSEKPHPGANAKEKGETNKIVYEIYFTPLVEGSTR